MPRARGALSPCSRTSTDVRGRTLDVQPPGMAGRAGRSRRSRAGCRKRRPGRRRSGLSGLPQISHVMDERSPGFARIDQRNAPHPSQRTRPPIRRDHTPPGPEPLGFTREQWETAYRELVLAPMALIERVVPGMRERGFGRIVSVGSSAIREPIPGLMLSNAHRAALLGALKTLSREVARDGVTVNTLLPGRIATDRIVQMSGSREAAEEAARSEVPAGRPGTVEEFAAVAAFLCSAQASYVTGTTVLVDGGLTRAV